MNLIAEIEGRPGASLHVATTEARIAETNGANVSLLLPRIATHFDDLRNLFPGIREVHSDQGQNDLERIEIRFRNSADASIFKRVLGEPNATAQIEVDNAGRVKSANISLSQPQDGLFLGLGGRHFALVDGKSASPNYPEATVAAIYVHMPSQGEQKVYGNRYLFHENGRAVLEHSHRVARVGELALDVRKLSTSLANPRNNRSRRIAITL